ncbi:MAG TPA: hypothetical protein VN461_08250 [Vicinamibacteria bacterium]|jgi:hypothetical protein|nr:hypothetical protein [Vicinamibacteria bacterium]
MRTRVGKSNAHRSLRLFGVGLVVLTGACGTAGLPTSATSTQTFTGVLSASGGFAQSVTVAGSGEFDLTLTSLSPQATITVGLGIGQPANGTCGLLTSIENAKVGSLVSLSVVAGSYCVVIYDIGNIQGSDNFTLTVVHP